jgi:hypothetical protein
VNVTGCMPLRWVSQIWCCQLLRATQGPGGPWRILKYALLPLRAWLLWDVTYDRCDRACVHAAALEKLDVVAAPAPSQVAPLEAVLSALRATQKAIEDSQTSTFGAEVIHLVPYLKLQYND